MVEVAADPWGFQESMLRVAERHPRRRVPAVKRGWAASERLHAAIMERRLTHRDDPALNAHVRQAFTRDTPRGWRLDKTKSRDNIDAVVALAMAVEGRRARHRPSSCSDGCEALSGALWAPPALRVVLPGVSAPGT